MRHGKPARAAQGDRIARCASNGRNRGSYPGLLSTWLLSAVLVCLLASTHVRADEAALIRQLAPEISPKAVSEAVSAMKCAQKNGVGTTASRLAIIDYTIPSREPRLWVMDLKEKQLLFTEHVAHGQGSGGDVPDTFSDRNGSHQTSLGLFLTDATYQGGNGYSLRLHGLSKGLNESAMQRLIVMHGAGYVNPDAAASMGRLGRSWGCPAVRTEVARPMIDTLKLGQFIYAYGPGTADLSTCKTENLALAGVTSYAGRSSGY
ncbi:MAG: murein L,D-transpeptidase catalytic domain family protein [Pseudomonadales bacterium]|nr:murein L,D-transpeptidase catalytic domain family protein [Halioglobus sp.]MCP5128752.1 murein L,D-transpeptidase catalytic domain family protein [Pseudomonadales bacterium]